MSSYYKSEGGAFRDFVSARAFFLRFPQRRSVSTDHSSFTPQPARSSRRSGTTTPTSTWLRPCFRSLHEPRSNRSWSRAPVLDVNGQRTLVLIFIISLRPLLLTKIVLLVTLTCVVLSRMPRDYDTPSCPRRNRASDGRDKHRRLPGALRAPENLRQRRPFAAPRPLRSPGDLVWYTNRRASTRRPRPDRLGCRRRNVRATDP